MTSTGQHSPASQQHDPGGQRREPRAPLTERIAGWSVRHRKTAVFGWLLLVAVIFMAGQSFGTKNLPEYSSGQAGRADRALEKAAPAQFSAYSEAVLIQSKTAGATFGSDPAMRHAAAAVATSLATVPKYATGIRTPLSAGGRSLVSKDGRSALVTFSVPGNVADVSTAASTDQRAVAAAAARYPSLRIAESGDASIQKAISSSLNFSQAEATSIPVTLILLLIVFGALVAAGIPLLLAVTALSAALGVLAIVSHWLVIDPSTPEVVVVIGMAVGVDYSLFYLRREREERARGRSHAEALAVAARTSGRTILVSGLTVITALTALFLTGGGPFPGIAVATIAVVAIAMIGSLTVLPALLAWLGPRADAGRIPFLGRNRAAARPSRLWGVLARRVVARPVIWGGVATIALLALAAPALGLRLGQPAVDAPRGTPTVRTLNEIERAFPQAPAPAEVVVTGRDVTGPRVLAAVSELRARTSAHGPVREPVTTTQIGGGRALVVGVTLAGGGQDTTSYQALATLRDRDLPATLGKVPGISYAVTGDTAGSHDNIQHIHDVTPAVFALVAVLAFVVLMIAFRSAVIPVVSIILNLLSVAAAYGVVTLIFQDGRLQGLLHYTSFGAIVWWEPLFMFAFLFGISMDYHVFILSRIRELWSRGATPREAVTGGIASSGGVVTSAALIMVAVFSIFVTMSLIDLKILGVGMAAAILIDATVVRGVLLPATLSLLGDRAWRLRRPKAAPGRALPQPLPQARR
ncbi:MAG TPA: MMPL family transporter [Streptosporangiaceae bacterium]|jgi:RND superfamily putative drug exporter